MQSLTLSGFSHRIGVFCLADILSKMKYYFKCPGCGNETDFVKPTEQGNGSGCLMLFFGGIFPFLLFSSLNGARIQCDQCKLLFAQPSLPSNKSAIYLGLLVGLIITVIFVSVFFFCIPGLARILPEIPAGHILEEAIHNEPRVATYLIIVLSAFTVLPLWVAAALITNKYHRNLKSKFLYSVPWARDPRLPEADTDFRDDRQNDE